MSFQGIKQNPEPTKEDLRQMTAQINELTKALNGANGGLNIASSPTLTGNQSITSAYSVYICDASTGAMTLTVPSIDSVPNRAVWVKKIDNTSNAVIWNAAVDGSTSASIVTQYTSLTFHATAGSSEWRII